MKILLKSFQYAVLALILFTSLAYAQTSKLPIRIAWQPDPNVPYYLASSRQFFEEAGLAPEHIKFLAAPPMFAALQSSSVDIADMGIGPAIIAKSQGIDIKLIMVAVDVSGSNALIVQKNLNINSAKDLKGLKVGAQRGTTPYIGLSRYLEKANMSLSDIQFIDLSAPNIIPAFRKGDIDAAWVWSPWQNQLIAAGGKKITSNKAVGSLAPQVWAVRAEWAKSNPEALRRFIASIDKSFKQMDANPEGSAQQLMTNLNLERPIAVEVLADSEFPNLQKQGNENYILTPISSNASKGLKQAIKQTADFLFSQGIIKNQVDANELVDSEPLKKYLSGSK